MAYSWRLKATSCDHPVAILELYQTTVSIEERKLLRSVDRVAYEVISNRLTSQMKLHPTYL